MLQEINSKIVEKQVKAERAFMAEIGGGCRYPVAAHADIEKDKIIFRAMAFKPGFGKIEKVKISVTEKELLKSAKMEAQNIISKYKLTH